MATSRVSRTRGKGHLQQAEAAGLAAGDRGRVDGLGALGDRVQRELLHDGLARVLAERQGTDLAVRRDQVSVGVNAGWRIPIVAGLYATPWIGIGWSPNARQR